MISVCVVNYGRSSYLANLVKSLEIAAVNYDVELVVVEFPSDESSTEIITFSDYFIKIICSDKFSSGHGRNKALAAAQGDVIVMLDADMIVPPNFLSIIQKPVLDGFIACPLYRRQIGKDSNQYSDGNGYGNVAFSKAVKFKMMERYANAPWPVYYHWGSEDVIFVQRAIQLGCPVWRDMVEGFIHQWHSKTSEWYTRKA